MARVAKRVLFWIDGPAPTPKDITDAEAIPGFANIQFRNAQHVPVDGALEDFDELAGDHIPQRYADQLAARLTIDQPAVALTSAPVPATPVGPDPATGTNTPEASEAWGKPKGTV